MFLGAAGFRNGEVRNCCANRFVGGIDGFNTMVKMIICFDIDVFVRSVFKIREKVFQAVNRSECVD